MEKASAHSTMVFGIYWMTLFFFFFFFGVMQMRELPFQRKKLFQLCCFASAKWWEIRHLQYEIGCTRNGTFSLKWFVFSETTLHFVHIFFSLDIFIQINVDLVNSFWLNMLKWIILHGIWIFCHFPFAFIAPHLLHRCFEFEFFFLFLLGRTECQRKLGYWIVS